MPSGEEASVDRLVQELIQTQREAASNEISRITWRVAQASFDTRIVRVATAHRGLSYQGRTVGDREDALFYHLVQRVVVERQWADGTSADGYLADLREAATASDARLAIYARRGGSVAIAIATTAAVLPPARRGIGELPNLLVVFSADRGMIVTGYQFSTIEATGIPKEARWLK
jgi:hypothetical protein